MPFFLRGVLALLMIALAAFQAAIAEEETFKEIRRFDAPEAVQAVAVDADHFYAIANAAIGKYDKRTGELKKQWKASEEFPLTHLNSGLVRDGKLYCAHSNYPQVPESSSIEIWDAGTLEHIGSHSLGVYEGSLTWVDWKDDAWWAVFAHYSKPGRSSDGRDNRWTTLVKMDSKWRREAGWVFPASVLKRLDPDSCSGGGFGPDGALYCTGHDRSEVYRLAFPKGGSILTLTQTLPAPITGQGIAWDMEHKHLYGIDRKHKQVVVSEWKETGSPLEARN